MRAVGARGKFAGTSKPWRHSRHRLSSFATRVTATWDASPVRQLRPLRDALRGVIEELLFLDALSFPALIGKFLHSRRASIFPLKLKNPSNHYCISVHQHRPHARRLHRVCPRKNLSLMLD